MEEDTEPVSSDDLDVGTATSSPANLAIRELPKKSRRLVLFDFSLAGVTDRATTVGTPPYLGPFLGTDRQPPYDAATERYAVAVTLHEMASAELPSWDDGVADADLLPTSEIERTISTNDLGLLSVDEVADLLVPKG